MADRGYEAWYERVRDSQGLDEGDLDNMEAEQVLKEFQDYEPSQKQINEIRDRQAKQDVDVLNENNPIKTDARTSISDDAARRPRGSDDTIISIKGDKPDIAADRVESSYEVNGTKFVRVDGKIYGAVNE